MSSSLQQIIREDFLRFDGLEALTYYSRVGEGATFDVGVPIPYALGTRGTTETEGYVAMFAPGRQTQIWHVLSQYTGDDDVVTTFAIKDRDRLEQADGTMWEIAWVERQSLGQRFRCHCYQVQS